MTEPGPRKTLTLRDLPPDPPGERKRIRHFKALKTEGERAAYDLGCRDMLGSLYDTGALRRRAAAAKAKGHA